ncbi:GntR family transcriptional regulator, partial [Candidatus Aerophobetes bacterium]|nr:GntR family transcriptional regulator [Candidatus Aerophobetes bacterium]
MEKVEKPATMGFLRKNLADEVYNWLKMQLLNRVYKAGERLYVEKIAEQLGVSYTPVQQAISKLTKEGLVINIPRKGAMVASLSSREIKEIFDLRALLECYAAGLAERKIILDTEEIFEYLLREMKKLIDQRDKIPEFVARDRDFHLNIIRLANNKKL